MGMTGEEEGYCKNEKIFSKRATTIGRNTVTMLPSSLRLRFEFEIRYL